MCAYWLNNSAELILASSKYGQILKATTYTIWSVYLWRGTATYCVISDFTMYIVPKWLWRYYWNKNDQANTPLEQETYFVNHCIGENIILEEHVY